MERFYFCTNHNDFVSIGVVEPVVAVVTVLQRVESDKLASGTATLRGYRGDDDSSAKVNNEILVGVHFARAPSELAV